MARKVPSVLKAYRPEVADFDEQLWPVNLTILVLAGCVAAIVVKVSDFADPRLLHNGWNRLAAVGIMVALLLLGVLWLQGRMLRRLQLCIALCLLIHLSLFVYLYVQKISAAVQWEATGDDAFIAQHEEITVPDYHWQQIEEPEIAQNFDERIETKLPQPQQLQAAARQANQAPVPTEVSQPDQLEVPEPMAADPSIARQPELSAPRRADAAAGAQISRQDWKHLPRPNEPVPNADSLPQSNQQEAALPTSTPALPQHEDRPMKVDQRQVFEQASSERETSPQDKLARRATQPEPSVDVPTTPKPSRNLSHPSDVSRAQAPTPDPTAVTRQDIPSQPNAPPTSSARREAEIPPAAALPTESAPPTPAVPLEAAAPQRRSAQTPRPTSRPATPTRPSPEPSLIAAQQPDQTPLPADQPTNVSDAAAPQPAGSAVSQQADARSGIMQNAPPGLSLPPMTRAEQLPAAMAPRRRTASQEEPPGPAPSPASPNSLAKLSAGVALPSTAIPTEANPASLPAAIGGTPPSRLEAAASAAVRRAAAEAKTGTSLAAPGIEDIGIGAGMAVARIGQARAAGTDRPSSIANASVPRLARTPGPPDSTTASGTMESTSAIPGAVASSPDGNSTPALSLQASAARRAGAFTQAVPKDNIGAGQADLSGVGEAVPTAQSIRVSRQEANDSAMAGGGAVRPGRTSSGAIVPNALAEPAEQSLASPGGDRRADAPPLLAQVNGPRRQASGLPGGLEGLPRIGAAASLTGEGAPLLVAAARRATSTQQDAGGADIGASRSVTMRRATLGTDLPAAAVAVENTTELGAGGLVSSQQGALPSSLPTGSGASVRRELAAVPLAQATTSAGNADAPGGAAETVALAGRSRRLGEGPPALARGASGSAPSRSTLPSGDAATGPGAAQPTMENAANQPASAQGSPGQPAPAAGPGATKVPLVAASDAGARQSAQLPGNLLNRQPGQGATQLGPNATTPGMVAGPRRLPQGDQPPPTIAAEAGRGLTRSTDAPGLPRGIAAVSEEPAAAAASTIHTNSPVTSRGDGAAQPRRQEGGLLVQIAAMAGAGGLGYDLLPDVGLPSRRARPESDIVHTISRRFVIERSGGAVAIDSRVREQPGDAYRQRGAGLRGQIAQVHGGSEGTERAVEMGLDFLARHQFPDGHWSLHQLPPSMTYADPALGQMQADTAATGLALLAYLGAGYTHLDDKHRAIVSRGLDWLVSHQKPNGDLFTGGTRYAWFYSHGIASIAICEAYGMTQDPELRDPARNAIQFIIRSQHPTRGGWRYDVNPSTGQAVETDTSVSGWQLMALKSAQMAGLEVPSEPLRKLDLWLDAAAAPSAAGQYVYNPFASVAAELRAGRFPNLAMTAEAMLMRMYLGRQRSDPGLAAGARHLSSNLPQMGTAAKPLRDCYYWYYATQAMFQMQGDHWSVWNNQLQRVVEGSQVQQGETAGSWHPFQPIPDRWGQAGGRLYVTALHLLMLEVYYRHLPLFQELIK